MVGKFVKQDVREWYPSTAGPLLSTMTDSLLAPGRAVRSKRHHVGELGQSQSLTPSGSGRLEGEFGVSIRAMASSPVMFEVD